MKAILSLFLIFFSYYGQAEDSVYNYKIRAAHQAVLSFENEVNIKSQMALAAKRMVRADKYLNRALDYSVKATRYRAKAVRIKARAFKNFSNILSQEVSLRSDSVRKWKQLYVEGQHLAATVTDRGEVVELIDLSSQAEQNTKAFSLLASDAEERVRKTEEAVKDFNHLAVEFDYKTAQLEKTANTLRGQLMEWKQKAQELERQAIDWKRKAIQAEKQFKELEQRQRMPVSI